MSLTEAVDQLKKRLRDEINHPYVRQFLSEPEIDWDKLVVYYLLFGGFENESFASTCALALMVAELGLETHEQMTTSITTGQEAVRKRQLIALSGDYYSSLYYYILAKANQSEITGWVARAIQEYNVKKSELFYPPFPIAREHMIKLLQIVESKLVTTIAEKLERGNLTPLLQSFFLLKRLMQERGAKDSKLQTYLMGCFSLNHLAYAQWLQSTIQIAREQFEISSGAYQRTGADNGELVWSYLREQVTRFRVAGTTEEGHTI
ncbi:heptaprenyl diphosphate synthase component 1 [Sporolactobacillus spathodeae]|uniref:Heptaprenyl diphosphate synthase n=1 Tax=Sporolactobacillus spathodeae TaxID=1465502 RepID=A0ABS2Q8Q4_9BACL|nr:heptaprenyl diphosphate synthase component 1 [Sporolactobacillus spathodeae]MBM7658165.1 heptaprenyl diphosphate synthase [Sporolactobacillus spathodeae]